MDNVTEQIYLLNTSENQPVAMEQKVDAVTMTSQDLKDFSTVCRICATVTESVMPIFEGEGLQSNLADKIHKHLPILVTTGDVLPRVVCYQCANTLLAWHELVQCAVQADVALRAHLQNTAPAAPDRAHLTEKEKSEPSIGTRKKTDPKLYDMLKRILVSYFSAMTTMNEDSLDLEIVCQECMVSSNNVAELASHLQISHAAVCDSYTNLQLFIQNKITFEEALKSELSDTDSRDDSELETTENPSGNLPHLFCPFCESLFTSSTRLIYHLNRHMDMSTEKKLLCCDETFDTTKKFAEHLQETHVSRDLNDLALVCRSCGHRAGDPDELRSHITAAHDKDARKNVRKQKQISWKNQRYIPAVCPECNKTFSNKYNMFVHMNNHHGKSSSTFPCDKCRKSYASKVNLNNHKKLVHDGILDFPCTLCGEAFPTRLARDVHSRIHTGDTPFTCQYCNKSFRAKNTLDRHIDMHLDVRKYECHLCPKKFRKRTHLNYHSRTHEPKE